MNTTRDTKAAVKAQKKQQKLVKKQQLQKSKIETDQLNKNQKNALQTARLNRNPTTAINHNNNNNNNINSTNNNNNLNETNNNNTNVSQKFREYYEQQQLQKQLINSDSATPLVGSVPPKFERSGSFSLKGKLSKLINSITSSKESLNKIEDENELPFKFTRSRSMILPRRTNRRSLVEPQLEQLSEEDPTSPASPRKNSIEPHDSSNTTPLGHQSMANAVTSTPVEGSPIQTRKTSTPVLTQDGSFDPIANFKKRRSSTLISSFRTTFGLSSEKKKDKLNNKWRASLQSLQAVDNMVSYENMSFIDYDKFNTYEKQLERKLSQISLMDPSLNSPIIPDNSLISDNSSYVLPSPCTPSNISTTSPFVTPQTVVRRRKTTSSLSGSARELAKRRSASRNSFSMDPDYEHNLDKPRNVYRESLDSRKLVLLNDISRNSYILDSDLVDILDLASTPLTSTKRPYYKRCCSQISTERTKAGQDVIDGTVNVQVSEDRFEFLNKTNRKRMNKSINI